MAGWTRFLSESPEMTVSGFLYDDRRAGPDIDCTNHREAGVDAAIRMDTIEAQLIHMNCGLDKLTEAIDRLALD
jgi:hypothetical protein